MQCVGNEQPPLWAVNNFVILIEDSLNFSRLCDSRFRGELQVSYQNQTTELAECIKVQRGNIKVYTLCVP